MIQYAKKKNIQQVIDASYKILHLYCKSTLWTYYSYWCNILSTVISNIKYLTVFNKQNNS